MPPRKSLSPVVFNRLVLQLREKSGRDLVVLGGALLDAALERALFYHFTPEAGPTRTSLLDERGALGSFGARIDAAVALGLVNPRFGSRMHDVRRVRNVYSHAYQDPAFDEPSVSSYVDRMDPIAREDYASSQLGGIVRESTYSWPFEFDGEDFDAAKVDMIIDASDHLGFFVPKWNEQTEPHPTRETRFRYMVWSCILVAVAATEVHWHNDVELPAEEDPYGVKSRDGSED